MGRSPFLTTIKAAISLLDGGPKTPGHGDVGNDEGAGVSTSSRTSSICPGATSGPRRRRAVTERVASSARAARTRSQSHHETPSGAILSMCS